VVTKSGLAFWESLFFGGFRAIAASGEGVPLSPPSISDDAESLQNKAFPEPPEIDGVAPRCSTAAAQVAIIETPVKGKSASNLPNRTACYPAGPRGAAVG
jgi:hypothetical protein